MPASDGGRQRRYDPDRRRRIAEATIRVVARGGVENASLRAIAREADVPVGSLTYHYGTRDELIASAISLATELNTTKLEALLSSFSPEVDLAHALAAVVEEYTIRERDQLVIDFELFMASRRVPALASASQEWIDESDSLLARYTSGLNVVALGQVFQGMLFESVILGTEFHAADTEQVFRHVLRPDEDPA